MKDISIAISGMSCGHCLNAVKKTLAAVPGIELKSLRIGRADLSVGDDPTTVERVKTAIMEAGYTVEGIIA